LDEKYLGHWLANLCQILTTKSIYFFSLSGGAVSPVLPSHTSIHDREGELETYLTRNAGRSNAFTGNEETCYYLTVNQDALKGALDIYASFFVAPLFSSSGIDREINAVNSENAKNLNSDSWRIGQTLKLRYNQNHPITKFGTGNSATLSLTPKASGVDVRKELLSFYKKYYSANQMTLSMSGKEDLDTLQTWATQFFSDIPNTDVPPAEAAYAGIISPIEPGSECFALGVVPVQDIRSLELTWQVPFTSGDDREMRTLGKPHQVLGAIVNYEGKGSLAAYLKNDLALVTSVTWTFSRTSDMELFTISLGLTPNGLTRKDEVIGAVFSYLDVIKAKSVPQYILDETTQLAEIFWRFKEAEGPRSVIAHAGNMQKFTNARDWLAGPALIRNLDIAAVQTLLEKLSVEAVLVSYVSQDLKSADLVEKWYGTHYERRKIDKASWNIVPIAALTLPRPNPFIPANFEMLNSRAAPPSEGPAPPKLVLDTATWRVFIKADTTYGQPRAYAYFNIALPDTVLGSQTCARTSALSRLYDLMMSEALTESTYDASLAGLSYAFGLTQRGVLLSVSGFNDKLPAFIETVASAVVTYVPNDEGKLARVKDILSRSLKAFDFQQPYQHAAAYAQQVTMLPSVLPLEVLEEVESITLAELQDWVKSLWKHGFGQALLQGNLNENQALESARKVAAAFALKVLPETERGMPRFLQLPLAREGYGNVLLRPEPNVNNNNSAVIVQFQHGDREQIKQQLAMEVLGAIIANPFFTELRTKQQLGYIVSGGVSNREGVRSLVFSVQSSFADSAYLTEKVFEFVNAFSLKDISDERIAEYVQSIVVKKLEKDKRLASEVGRHWSEIVIGRFDYTRVKKEAEVLKTLKRADLEAVFTDIVLPYGSGRRVLTTQVSSSATTGASKGTASSKTLEKGVVIGNTKEFVANSRIFTPFKGMPGTLAQL